MPQAVTGIDELLREARKKSAVRDAAIAGTCPVHGEFTRGGLARAGIWWDGVCPECHRESLARKAEGERRELARDGLANGRSGVPPRFRGKTFDGFSPCCDKARSVLRVVRSYADDFPRHAGDGVSLIFCGRTGTGKTHLACALIGHIAAVHGLVGMYASAYGVTGAIKACYGKRDADERAVIEKFVTPDLLVIDEVGVQFGTETEKIILFEVLNGRYERMKPSVVISNLPRAEMAVCLGGRVMDRLRDNGGATLVFDWESRRK